MGDEHVGEVELVLEPVQQFQDALGDQLVERGGHLVANDELRVRGERARDPDALLLPARELGRQAVDIEVRLKLDLLQQLLHPPAQFGAPEPPVEPDRAPDNVPDAELRVQRGIRHLVDHLDLAELVLAAVPVAGGQGLAVEAHLSAARRQEAGDAARDGGLAGAGLADDRDRPPGMDVEGHIVQHVRRRAVTGGHSRNRDHRHGAPAGRRLLRPPETPDRPERFRVVLLRVGQHGAGVVLLHLVAPEQHLDPVRHLRHHGEVVGDVDGRGAELVHDVPYGGQHLDLGGDIERRGRLVEDDEVRAAGHRHGRHGALQLPAGDLVGIAEADALRFRQPEPGIERHRVFLAFLQRGDSVQHRAFGVLVDQPVGRVEARRRRLRDIGDAPAEQAALGLFRRRDEVDAVEFYGAAGDAAAVAGEAHGREADGGLAGAGLADEAEHLAAGEVQVDAVHDGQPVLPRQAFDLEVPDRYQGAAGAHRPDLLGVSP